MRDITGFLFCQGGLSISIESSFLGIDQELLHPLILPELMPQLVTQVVHTFQF